MAKENIRGTAPITQNEENVKRFLKKFSERQEAQSTPFVNPKSAKLFSRPMHKPEADVKDFFGIYFRAE